MFCLDWKIAFDGVVRWAETANADIEKYVGSRLPTL